MHVKKIAVSVLLCLSLLGISLTLSAAPYSDTSAQMKQQLSFKQKRELRPILRNFFPQLRDLAQQNKALQTQLEKKIQTKGTTWDDISALVSQLNEVHSKLFTLVSQTRLKSYQKVGVVVPKFKSKDRQSRSS